MIQRRITALVFFVFIFLGVSGHAFADTLNDTRTFFINSSYDSTGASQLSATLRAVSGHAYWYVSDEYWNSLGGNTTAISAFLAQASDEFDQRIYSAETSFFGSEPNPSIDGDPRITILMAPLKANVGGYFDTSNEYHRSEVPLSNEREMITITVPGENNDSRRLLSYLAHEFQHLISFNQKETLRSISDDIWLNELRSEYAITQTGYNDPFNESNLQRRLGGFLNNPTDSLTEWKNLPVDYSVINMFGEYVAEHTIPSVIGNTTRNNFAGMTSLESAVAQSGFRISAIDLFSHWLVASFLNDTTISSDYGYTRSDLRAVRVAPTQSIINLSDSTTYTIPTTMKDWEGHWYDIARLNAGTKNTLRVTFASSSLGSFHIPYVIFYADGTYTIASFDPSFTNPALLVGPLGSNVTRLVFMPFKKDKMSGFGADEPSLPLTMTIDRTDQAVPVPTPTPALVSSGHVRPEDYGLHEGDFIRADGDKDVYIVNEFGYKRLVLSPTICLLYGHLGARGCFDAVHVVSPAVRDAFQTSWYFTNGETHDGRVYLMTPLGEDSAHIRDTGEFLYNFQDGPYDFSAVSQINTKEFNQYSR